MDVNKNKAILKGLFFTRKRFPVALVLSNGLLIHLLGCNGSQVKNWVLDTGNSKQEAHAIINNSDSDSDSHRQSHELPTLEIDRKCYQFIFKYDNPCLQNCKIKIYDIYKILCEKMRGFRLVSTSPLKNSNIRRTRPKIATTSYRRATKNQIEGMRFIKSKN